MRSKIEERAYAVICSKTKLVGVVTEWLKVLAWKAGVPCKGYRGFESLPLRNSHDLASDKITALIAAS